MKKESVYQGGDIENVPNLCLASLKDSSQEALFSGFRNITDMFCKPLLKQIFLGVFVLKKLCILTYEVFRVKSKQDN